MWRLTSPLSPMPTTGNLEVFSEIRDDDGNHLTLRFIEVPQPPRIDIPGLPKRDEKFYDFHSLVWDTQETSTWIRRATIAREDLESDGVRRWVSDLHSLDANCGTAVIKIAEGDWRVTYSWREWDFCRNQEVRLIEKCDSPFDALSKSDDAR